jgi:hypothetical protein
MGREYYVWSFSHPPAMGGEIGSKNCSGLKSEVPFVTARFLPNPHILYSTDMECLVFCLIRPSTKQGTIRMKNCFGL